jgi:hypothetical protein
VSSSQKNHMSSAGRAAGYGAPSPIRIPKSPSSEPAYSARSDDDRAKVPLRSPLERIPASLEAGSGGGRQRPTSGGRGKAWGTPRSEAISQRKRLDGLKNLPVHPLFNRRVSGDPLQRRLSACKTCRCALQHRVHCVIHSNYPCFQQKSRSVAT